MKSFFLLTFLLFFGFLETHAQTFNLKLSNVKSTAVLRIAFYKKENKFPDEGKFAFAKEFKPTKTEDSSGQSVDIYISPAIQEVIDRARAIKKQREIISPFLFPNLKGTAYTRFGIRDLWSKAKARAGSGRNTKLVKIKSPGVKSSVLR
jgi:hypothetical protein